MGLSNGAHHWWPYRRAPKRWDGRTDAAKYIISLILRSIASLGINLADFHVIPYTNQTMLCPFIKHEKEKLSLVSTKIIKRRRLTLIYYCLFYLSLLLEHITLQLHLNLGYYTLVTHPQALNTHYKII